MGGKVTTGEREEEVNIHGRAHCTHNSGYNKANKDILVPKVGTRQGELGRQKRKQERTSEPNKLKDDNKSKMTRDGVVGPDGSAIIVTVILCTPMYVVPAVVMKGNLMFTVPKNWSINCMENSIERILYYFCRTRSQMSQSFNTHGSPRHAPGNLPMTASWN